MIIRPVAKNEFYPNAYELVCSEWGNSYAAHFLEEVRSLVDLRAHVLFGVFSETKDLLAIGLITKEQIDYALWGITWLVVKKEHRKQGIGKTLLERMEDFAAVSQADYPTDDCLILLTTATPDYYRRFKYEVIKQWNQSTLMIKDISDKVI